MSKPFGLAALAVLTGTGVLGIGSLALSQDEEAPRSTRANVESEAPGVALPVAGTAKTAKTANTDRPDTRLHPLDEHGEGADRHSPELGLSWRGVSTELAAHLGLESGAGCLVRRVTPDSLAARVGLEPLDVILTLNRVPAAEALAEFDPSRASELTFLVVRAGVERYLALSENPAFEPPRATRASFFSSESLGADHPFRRVATYRALKESYEGKAQSFDEAVRAADENRRAAEKEAKASVAELEERAKQEVQGFLAEKEREWLARLDERLAPERLTRLHSLRVDLDARIPAARRKALEKALADARQRIESLPGKATTWTADDDAKNELDRERKRYQKLGRDVAQLMDERVLRPWSTTASDLDQNVARLTTQHDERSKWTSDTVAQIRKHLRERVECAVDRAETDLAKSLHQRLSRMETPAPGEIEGTLNDICGQVDVMCERFLERTEAAVAMYEELLGSAREELEGALESGLEVSEAAAHELTTGLETELAAGLGAPFEIERSWGARARLDTRYDGFRMALLRLTHATRDSFRPGALGLRDALREERVASEDAWKDLRKLLGELKSSASADCWKLDGPHLDGRFPKPEGEGQPSTPEAKKSGDVARNDRNRSRRG